MPKADLVLDDRVVLRTGEANGLKYTSKELEPLAEVLNGPPPLDEPSEANRDSLFLDHGDGTQTWIGVLKDFWGDEEAGALKADIHIVDSDTAKKINFQMKEGRPRFGISPRLLLDNEKGKALRIRIKSFSLVLNPAGGDALMLFAGPVVKVDKKKHIVLGPVLIPGRFDHQEEVIDEDELEKTAHEFLISMIYGDAVMKEQHRQINNKVKIVESYLAPCELKIKDHTYPKGTWMVASKIFDEEVWKKIEDGIYQGYSVGGQSFKIPVD